MLMVIVQKLELGQWETKSKISNLFHSQNTDINPHFTSFGNFFSLSDVRFIVVCEIGKILQIEQILW